MSALGPYSLANINWTAITTDLDAQVLDSFAQPPRRRRLQRACGTL